MVITDLDVVSYGRGNYIDLGGGVNDLQTVSVSGKADIYIDGFQLLFLDSLQLVQGMGQLVSMRQLTGNTHLSDATAHSLLVVPVLIRSGLILVEPSLQEQHEF